MARARKEREVRVPSRSEAPLPPDLIERSIDLLLNRVREFKWDYWEVDLRMEPSLGGRELLEALHPDGLGRLRWTPQDPESSPPDSTEIFGALSALFEAEPHLPERAFQRIFDRNALENRSGAQVGFLGELNAKEHAARQEAFRRAVRAGRWRRAVRVVAEGDSWFQFPAVRKGPLRLSTVRDLLDHLMDREDLCVHSLAAGGDWLSAMLHSRDYVEELSLAEPDLLLFSGGGNDLLGDGRVGNMVVRADRALPTLSGDYRERLFHHRSEALAGAPFFDAARYERGLRVLANEFFQFMNLLFVQYFLFLSGIRQSRRFEQMAILTQGYDFAIPTRESKAPWLSLQRAVNRWAGSGEWLWLPMELKRLAEEEKRSALYAMVLEFNELLLSLVHSGRFDPIFHIDARGLAGEGDWYDEIHLTSAGFLRVAKLYGLAIREFREGRTGNGRFGSADLPRAEELWGAPLPGTG